MCHSYIKHFFTTAIILTLGSSAFAQTVVSKANRENAPYSRFGIGEFVNGANTMMRGAGSVTSPYSNPFAVNTYNPASYASLLLTTYEGGGSASGRTITSGANKYNTGTATLSYMNIGIPVTRHGGLAIGYRPMNHIYYNLQDTGVVSGYGNSIKTYFGDGSLHYAFIGAAGKYKGFSIGFNFGYAFGTTVTASLLQSYNDSVNVYDSRFSNTVKTGGIYWNGGAMYSDSISNKIKLSVGATLAISQDLNTTNDEYWLSNSGISGSSNDTNYSLLNQKSTITLPMFYSGGVWISGTNNRWGAGIDYSGANWSQFRKYGNVDSVASSSYKVAVGAEYTPDPTSIRKYIQRITYRIGGYYGKDYVQLRNTDINYYALTFGASFPFKRATDKIHTSFEIGSRGTEANGLFRESYYKFSLGISLNDRWFIKRRYD